MYRLISLTLLLVACATTEPEAKAPKSTAKAPAAATAAPAGGILGNQPSTVATIDGKPITLAEVDKQASPQSIVIKAQQDAFNQRKTVLDNLINEQILTKEAEARSLDGIEALMQAEVQSKIEQPTDADVEKFYNENAGAMQGQPLEAMAPRIKGHLAQQKMGERMSVFLAEMRKKYKVEVFLEAPRIDVAAGDSPRYGSAEAPVQIIEFSDFQCPYCTRAADTIEQVKEHYGDKVSVVYRHFPLPMHDRAHRAAEASECAHAQGKFWEFHDQLFANQQQMGEADFERYATTVGLDGDKFKACMASGEMKSKVDTDLEEGQAAGMSGTPGFYINGRMLGGAQPFESFKEVIDAELDAKG